MIAEGEYYGMQTFDQSLLNHVHGRATVSEEVAMDYASSPHDFKLMLASPGPARQRHRAGRSADPDGDGRARSAPSGARLPVAARNRPATALRKPHFTS